MENRDGEIHMETDEARGASSPNIVRWVLGIGLLLAIIGLSLAWIIPATSHHDRDENVSAQINAQKNNGTGTDSIVDSNASKMRGANAGAPNEGAVPSVPNNASANSTSEGK